MLSRVAESLFWMSRYVERAENVARFIDVNLNLMLDASEANDSQWESLVYTTGDQETFYERYERADQESVIRFLTFDRENPNSILSCLSSARENARVSRDMISSQMWEYMNRFYLMVRDTQHDMHVIKTPYSFFDRIRRSGYTLEGVNMTTMSQNEAWHFSRLGQMIERADKTSRILDVKYYLLLPRVTDVGTSIDLRQWTTLLKSVGAIEMYRRAHGRLSPRSVVEFLLLDRQFPRSVHYCVEQAEASLLAAQGGEGTGYRSRSEQLLGRLRSDFAYTDIEEMMNRGLHEAIDDLQVKLNTVGEAVQQQFFAVAV